MATAPTNLNQSPLYDDDNSIGSSLQVMEEWLANASDQMFDPTYFSDVGDELRRLHARVRIHHATDPFASMGPDEANIPPEYEGEMSRLRAEHSQILGQLDRLIRCVDTIGDHPLEDREVFIMRMQELVAVLHRHMAEEDRLFYLAVWRDTGGES